MNFRIALTLMAAVPAICLAVPSSGCDDACASNATAVFSGKTKYEMRVDDSPHAHVEVRWRSRTNAKLKPVAFEGVAPVRLRNTRLQGMHFDVKEPCKAVVALLEFHGDDFDAYEVPLHNKQCKV